MSRFATPARWVGELLGGDVPPYVDAVPVCFRDLLREYLRYMRTERKRATATLYQHGEKLVAFFEWLGTNVPHAATEELTPDHIANYLEHFRFDGRIQGRNSKRDGHQKTVLTISTRASILRSFFAWATQRRLCQMNPVEPYQFEWGLPAVHPLPEAQVADLLRAWTAPSANPRAAAVGSLCLVYGLTTSGLATLPLNSVDLSTNTFHGLAVPVPIPEWLRPVLERYMHWRREQPNAQTSDYFVVVQRHSNPASLSCIYRILRPYGVNVRQLRDTALAQTILHGHLKLLTVFGLGHQSTRRYEALARLVQNTRKVHHKPNLW